MTGDEWLAKLKPGDKVIATRGYGGEEIETVEKVTATGRIVLNGGRTYNPDGRIRGGNGYHPSRLVEPTREDLDRVERSTLVSKVAYMAGRNAKAWSLAKLRLVWAAMIAVEPEDA